MEDNNDQQYSNNPVSGHPDDKGQNQYRDIRESTYWEASQYPDESQQFTNPDQPKAEPSRQASEQKQPDPGLPRSPYEPIQSGFDLPGSPYEQIKSGPDLPGSPYEKTQSGPGSPGKSYGQTGPVISQSDPEKTSSQQTYDQFSTYYQQQINAQNYSSQYNSNSSGCAQPGSLQQNYGQQNYQQPNYQPSQYNQERIPQTDYSQNTYNQQEFLQPDYDQQENAPSVANQQGYTPESNQNEYTKSGDNQQGYAPSGNYQQGYAPSCNYQQGYTQSGYNQQAYNADKYFNSTKEKSHKKLITVFLALLIILSGSAAAYAFRGQIINTFERLTKTPAEYYAFVEKKNISQSMQDIRPYLGLLNQNTAYNVKTNISINRDSLDSLLQNSLNASLSELEDEIGVPLNNFGINTYYGRKDNITNETITLRFNQVDLITAEFFINSVAKDFLVRIPELSKACLKISGNDTSSGLSLSKADIPTAAETSDLLVRYGNIIIDNLTHVELIKNSSLQLDTLSADCTKLSVTITNDDAKNISEAMLKEAREDEYIIKLLPMFKITKDEYQKSVDDSLTELKGTDVLLPKDFVMNVYVDKSGNIIGRDITSSSAEFSYKLLSKGHYDEFKMYLKNAPGTNLLEITGSKTKTDGAYDGKAAVKITDPGEVKFKNINIDVAFEDYRIEKKNNRMYQYGTFTVSSPELMGIQINSESSVKDGIQNNKLTLRMGASPLITVNSTKEYLDEYTVGMPPEDVKVYDYTDYDNYAASIDFEAFVDKLSEKLGVNLSGLLNNNGNDY